MQFQILYDDSGESEQYNEGNWYISDIKGHVLGDMSFYTEEEAKNYLGNFLTQKETTQ